jgi:hypothetical protein
MGGEIGTHGQILASGLEDSGGCPRSQTSPSNDNEKTTTRRSIEGLPLVSRLLSNNHHTLDHGSTSWSPTPSTLHRRPEELPSLNNHCQHLWRHLAPMTLPASPCDLCPMSKPRHRIERRAHHSAHQNCGAFATWVLPEAEGRRATTNLRILSTRS